MRGNDIVIHGRGGDWFHAYCAPAKSGAGPGLVLLHELFGINTYIREVADFFAAHGFLVVVPDLFWRQQRRVQLDGGDPAQRERAMQLHANMSASKAVDDCRAALEHVRSQPGCGGKSGVIGFCLGGKLAYLMAACSNADACVAYYGTGIHNALSEATGISQPLMLHIAGKDHLCPPEAQHAIIAALQAKAGLVTVHTYPQAGHGFARRGAAHYDEAAASDANGRTLAFLRRHLTGIVAQP